MDKNLRNFFFLECKKHVKEIYHFMSKTAPDQGLKMGEICEVFLWFGHTKLLIEINENLV